MERIAHEEERIPSWITNIFSADGNYEVSYKSNVFVGHDGDVTWVPPAMFKSSCRIDVEWYFIL